MRTLLILTTLAVAACGSPPRPTKKSADTSTAAQPAISTTRTIFVARGSSDGKPWKVEVY